MVNYVAKCLVRFLQENFNSGREKVREESSLRQISETNYLEYDFQSRPMEMKNSQGRRPLGHTRHLLPSINHDTVASSDSEASSTEDIQTYRINKTKRRKKFSKRKKISQDELVFGLDI